MSVNKSRIETIGRKDGAVEFVRYVRLKPYNPDVGNVLQRLTIGGTVFQEKKGWYKITDRSQAALLAEQLQVPDKDSSGYAFDVCTLEQAQALEASDKRRKRAKGRRIVSDVADDDDDDEFSSTITTRNIPLAAGAKPRGEEARLRKMRSEVSDTTNADAQFEEERAAIREKVRQLAPRPGTVDGARSVGASDVTQPVTAQPVGMMDPNPGGDPDQDVSESGGRVSEVGRLTDVDSQSADDEDTEELDSGDASDHATQPDGGASEKSSGGRRRGRAPKT